MTSWKALVVVAAVSSAFALAWAGACGPPAGSAGGPCEGTVDRCDRGLLCVDTCDPTSKKVDITCGPTCETCPHALDADGNCPDALAAGEGEGEGEGEGGQ